MKIEQITFTRFIAAILIVVLHYGLNIYPFNIPALTPIFQHSNIGVSYFFILSGFIMIIAYNHKDKIDTLEYYKNRFARIYPVYFLSLTMLLFLYFVGKLPIIWTDFILNFLSIQAWFPEKALSFNAPGWSLSVELLFYLIFPFLFNSIYIRGRNPKKYIIPILLLFILTQIVFHWLVASPYYKGYSTPSHNFIYYFPLFHLNEFLIGNLTGLFFLNKSRKNYDWPIVIIVSIITAALKYQIGLNFHNGLMAILFVPFILMMSLNNGSITTIFKRKPFVFLGEISFGIYILQLPIFIVAKFICTHIGISSKTVIFYFGIVLLITAAALSYKFIETPLRNRIKKLKVSNNITAKNALQEL